jgi:hypothetical protein
VSLDGPDETELKDRNGRTRFGSPIPAVVTLRALVTL